MYSRAALFTLLSLVGGASALRAADTSACGAATGTRFNLEPRAGALPQQQTSVDFLPGAGLAGEDLVVGVANDMRRLTSGIGFAPDFRGIFGITSQSGFYVHRSSATSACAPDFEGGIPFLLGSDGTTHMVGVGFMTAAADPARQAFFLLDSRVAENEGSATAAGLFRVAASRLLDSSACPDGTLSETEARNCIATTGVLVAPTTTFGILDSSPSLAIDERVSGTGAGNAYVAMTRLGSLGPLFVSPIVLAACTNTLSACSSPVVVSGADLADLANVAVRPDGGVTVTYTVYTGLSGTPAQAAIKYVRCTPGGAPAAPVCSPPVLITQETQALPFDPSDEQGGLEAVQFSPRTYPKHVHRRDANGIETYVVWDRCKVSTAIVYPGITFTHICPDSDLILAASNDNGETWHMGVLDAGNQDQFQASLKVDAATNTVYAAYFSSQADVFQHRPQLLLRAIAPGSATPDVVSGPVVVNTTPMEPNTDPSLEGVYIGNYPGLSVRSGSNGTRAYVHHTHTVDAGLYDGLPVGEQNNHLSRVDLGGGLQ